MLFETDRKITGMGKFNQGPDAVLDRLHPGGRLSG